MRTILLIDQLNLTARRMSFHENMEFNGYKTGGLFGFISLFSKYINLHKPDFIIVCSDTPPYKRKKIYPQYKEGRIKKTEEEKAYFSETMSLVNWFIETAGIYLWRENGYESDDLMASIVHQHKNECEIVLCSNDNDLFQLLHSNVILQRSKDIYMLDDFRKEFPELNKFDPSIWYEVAALYGGHNGVKQIYPKLGPKTAIKIIANEYKNFPEEYHDSVRFNISLTALPFDDELVVPELQKPNPKIGITQFKDKLLDKFGINTNYSMEKAFKHVFESSKVENTNF